MLNQTKRIPFKTQSLGIKSTKEKVGKSEKRKDHRLQKFQMKFFTKAVRTPFCCAPKVGKSGLVPQTTQQSMRNSFRAVCRLQTDSTGPNHTPSGVCQRARLLKPCFEKAVLKSSDWGARRFRDWAKGRVDPIRAHLALAEQETRLGGLDDVCVRGICNGIGLLQIISAFNHEGKPLASDDPEWDGITHNVLTNITFSARVIASKLVHEPEDLSSLAALYNGNPDLRALYAARVVKSYKAMKDCAI
jgi:hypothetical protein